jgi:glycosyltransferase involved in cell wall biosynthesis
MTRVFFWSAGEGGCLYYRCDLPATALRARGHDVWVSDLLTDAPKDVDTVVGQRVCLPGPTQSWQKLAATGQYRMVYEVDDNLLAVDPSNGPAWSFYSRPEIRANVIRNIEVADLVTVSTWALGEVVRKLNPNVAVLPNCIPASLLDAPKSVGRKGVVIGWSGGASHSLDLIELGDAPRRLLHRYPDVSLHTMGDAQAGAMMSKWNRDRVKWTPWIQTVPEFHETIDFDITLAPLRPSTFNQSKSPIRCLEAAALGIPVVASDFGPYADFVRDGETGFLASRPHQWTGYLTKLLDPFLRREMGAKARAVAAEHTIESNAHLWETALCEH